MITRTSTLSQHNTMLNQLLSQQNKLLQIQAQSDSGKKISTLSDNPQEISTIMNLNQQLAQITQYYKNLDAAETQLKVLDETFAEVNNKLNRINDLALSALNGTNDDATVQGMKFEVDQLIETVVSAANKNYNNSYIFSGARTTTTPYEIERDAAGQITGIIYNGSANGAAGSEIKLEISDGMTVKINGTGDTIFGDFVQGGGGSGLFQALGDLSNALAQSSTSPTYFPDLEDAVGKLQDGMKHVSTKRTEFGTNGSKVSMTRSALEDLEITTTGHKSVLVDLDLAESLSNLLQQNYAYQASMSTYSLLQQNSLLNYLKL